MNVREDRRLALDKRAYALVGAVLLAGLLLSIAVMIAGLLLAAIRGGDTSHVLPLDRELLELSKGSAAAVLDLGILLLFATPLLGVFAAFVEFCLQRDYAFVLATAGLLVMLAIAFGIALH